MPNITLDQLEDAALAALTPLRITEPSGYLRTLRAYQGELDVPSADQISVQCPAMLLFFSDIEYAVVSSDALQFIERPELTVFVVDQNWRGEKEARRGGVSAQEPGTYRMIRDARDRLAGKTFGLDIGPLVPRTVRSVLQSANPAWSIYAVRFQFSDVAFAATGD